MGGLADPIAVLPVLSGCAPVASASIVAAISASVDE
jgi:hypothetical protein